MRSLIPPLLLLLTWIFVAPASAASLPASLTVLSEWTGPVGHGAHRIYDSADGDRLEVSGDANSVAARVAGGTQADTYEVAFAAKPGEPLVPGVYTGTKDFYDGFPGMRLFSASSSCSSGSFEVRELALAADGSVERAWVLYEGCDGRFAGELRVGAPVTAGPAVVPGIARFPSTDVGWGGSTLPVVARPALGGRIVRAEVLGAAAEDFVVRDDRCSGALLGAGEPCEVWVRFMPKSAGTRLATLRVTDVTGAYTDVPLQAFAYGGERSLKIDSQPNGAGLSRGPESAISASGSKPQYVRVSVVDRENTNWVWDFSADELQTGRTYTGGIALNAGGGCERHGGTFTVHEISFDANGVRTLDIAFDHHCQDNPIGTRGRVKWRAGDTTPPAPWMVARKGATDIPGTSRALSGPPAPAPAPKPATEPVSARPAGPVEPASMTVISEPGDRIGLGGARVIDAAAGDHLRAHTRSEDAFYLVAEGGPYDERFVVSLNTPYGGPLVPGVYPGAIDDGHMVGRPAIAIWEEPRACDTFGEFEVRDFAVAPNGDVERAWIIYRQNCEYGSSMFGEIRIGQPAVPGPRAHPALVRWPAADRGGTGRDVPVQVDPSGARITRVEVVGSGAGDFPVRGDGCTDATNACTVTLGFVPRAAGTQRAWLRISDSTGARTDVPLQGFTYGGETVYKTGAPGNEIVRSTPEWRYHFEPSRSGVRVRFQTSARDLTPVDWTPAPGDILAPGTTYRGPYWLHGPMSNSGRDTPRCSIDSSLTVHELDIVRGEVRRLWFSWVDRCGGGTLAGTFKFRSADRTPSAPWLQRGPVTAVGAPGDETPTPTPTPTATATATPTATTTPTATATATATPTPTATPLATATPSPEPPAAPVPDTSRAGRVDPPSAAAFTAPPGPSSSSGTTRAAERVAASRRRLAAAVKRLRPSRAAAVRAASVRLGSDLRAYRAALVATGASTRAVDRQISANRTLRRELLRYERGRNRAAAEKAIARAAKHIASADLPR